MPVMMPGSAIGSTNSSEIASRPKNLARDSAAAASVPSTSASAVAIAATSTDSRSAGQMSGARPRRRRTIACVSPGGGNW